MTRSTTLFRALSILFLLSIFAPVVAQDGYKLRDIAFEGNQTLSDSDLKDLMELKEDDFLYRIQFWKDDRLFDSDALVRDTTRILHRYRTEGFLDAGVTCDVQVNEEKSLVYLKLEIDEGKPILLNDIRYEILADNHAEIEEILSRTDDTQERGERFRDVVITGRQEALLEALGNRGYPLADIDFKLHVHPARYQVDVDWTVDSKHPCMFGEIRVTGLENPLEKQVLRQATNMDSGEYRQSELKKVQRRIYQLGMFQSVAVKALLGEEFAGKIPVEIVLGEAPRHNVKVGVGWGIEDRFRVFAEYKKLGFLGGVRRLHLYAKHSYLEPVNVSMKFVQPDFLHTYGEFSLSPYYKREREISYTMDRLGANMAYQKSYSNFVTAYGNVNYEKNDIAAIHLSDEEVFGEEADDLYEKTVFTIGGFYDSSQPPTDPERGIYVGSSYSVAPIREVSDYEFYKIQLDARVYQRIASWLVVALKLKGGAMEPFGQSETTPVEDRFYAGGSYSVRGWQRSQLGPKNENGYPLGGNSLAEGSLELRYPIYDIFSGVVFLDGGNVWKDSYEYIANDLRFASGLGLRVKTPVGPIRLDFASPVFEKKKELQIHASIGHAF